MPPLGWKLDAYGFGVFFKGMLPANPKRIPGLVVDVDYDAVADRCAAITLVPGGVGPMTIAMLMSNCVTAAERLTA
jgi:5,10-methylene-tetrahydrofolate dehydrogenase/methenyl tetrahydrofolate cyclohydrolase